MLLLVQRKNKNILNTLDTTKDLNGNLLDNKEEPYEYKIEPAWFNIFGFIYLHYITYQAAYIVEWNKTFAFGKSSNEAFEQDCQIYFLSAGVCGLMTGLGITAGAHRLWAHGAYKANQKLKVMLVIFQTMAFQNSVIEWVRDHRVHHKFTDTNADPVRIHCNGFISY